MRAQTHPARPEAELDDRHLVALSRKGEERALTTLLDRYRLFVRHLVRPYFLAGSTDEDLVQEGMIGLFKAIRDFDEDHEAPFRAFAKFCIQRQIATAIKGANRMKHQPLNRSVSLEAPVRSHDGDVQVGDALSSRMPEPEDLVISAAEVDALRALVRDGLTRLEAEALRLYLDGHSYSEIAAALGNHAKAIDNSLQRIRTKVRRHLAERELQH